MANYTEQLNDVLERLGVYGGELPDNLITTKLDCIIANMDQLTQNEAPGIVEASTGTAITLNDSSDKQLQSLTVYGNSTQDGTPTLENPVEIVSVGDGGSVDVTVCGKNLADYKKAEARSQYDTVEIIENGVRFSGTYFFKIPILLEKNIQYSISAVNAPTVCLEYEDGTLSSSFASGRSIIPQKKVKALYVYKENPTVYDANVEIKNIQVELGSSATTYEPYKEQTITIELDEPLMAIDDYKDRIVEKDGVIGIERKIVSVPAVFERIVTSHQSVDYGTITISDGLLRSRAMSDYFISSLNVAPGNCYSVVPNSSVVACFEKNTFANVSELNAITGDSCINAVLETQTFNPLPSDIQEAWKKLKTYYPITNIINSESANMSVDYVADTKTYIDNATA